jgi:glucose/arabinose dehydrogenase
LGQRLRAALLSAAVCLTIAAPPAAATPSAGFSEHVVATGLTTPTAIAFLPDRRLLVTEKGGALKLVQGGTATTLTTIPVCTASEMGLLGIAPHPNFQSNGLVFLYRTKPAPGGCASSTGRFNQVVTVQMAGDTVVPGSLTERLTGIRTDGGNHDGGTLRIGPDQKLYVSVGDTGIGDSGPPGASTNPYSQDRGALEGKVLRLELDGLTPAAGNPFIGVAGARPEVFAFGFRNPFRMGFDPQSGRLWAGDVGQSTIEEIDVVQSGGNYAWPHCEGTLPAGCQANATPGPVIDPVFEYPHSGAPVAGRSVTGGAFATGSFGPFGGHYVFGDYTAGKLWVATPNAARDDIGTPSDFVTDAAGPVDIVFGPDEALYYVSINTGQVRRVVPGYARPQAASPVRVSLVPAHQQCTAPNRMHGPPLAFGSCNPPLQRSAELTVGTIDANGQASNSTGFLRMNTFTGNPGSPADEADAGLRVELTDVRRRAGLADYPGELRARLTTRITDKDNPPPSGAGASDGTVTDSPFEFTVPCAATPADPAVGSTCSVATTVDALAPGAIKEGRRSIWQLERIEVFDGGPDDDADTTPNTLFATPGLFVP